MVADPGETTDDLRAITIEAPPVGARGLVSRWAQPGDAVTEAKREPGAG